MDLELIYFNNIEGELIDKIQIWFRIRWHYQCRCIHTSGWDAVKALQLLLVHNFHLRPEN
jgi:hypothetical protein